MEVWLNSWEASGNEKIYTSKKIINRNDGSNITTSDYNGYYVGKNSNPVSCYVEKLDFTNPLYFPGPPTTQQGYWLASSSAENNQRVMYVRYGGYMENTSYNSNYIACRPVVRLPASVLGEYVNDAWTIE